MSERSYGQYCGLAAALDAIGERWSLLVVRDLLLGPKRSVDLLRALPGIPTNVLYTRLSALQRRGIVARRVTPPPTPATLYELTPDGRRLETVLEALDTWGVPRLRRTPGRGQTVRDESIDLAIARLARSLDVPTLPFTFEVRVADKAHSSIRTARIEGNAPVVVSEGAGDSPDAVLRCDVRTLYALASRERTLGEAVRDASARLDGRAAVVRRLAGKRQTGGAASRPSRARIARTARTAAS